MFWLTSAYTRAMLTGGLPLSTYSLDGRQVGDEAAVVWRVGRWANDGCEAEQQYWDRDSSEGGMSLSFKLVPVPWFIRVRGGYCCRGGLRTAVPGREGICKAGDVCHQTDDRGLVSVTYCLIVNHKISEASPQQWAKSRDLLNISDKRQRWPRFNSGSLKCHGPEREEHQQSRHEREICRYEVYELILVLARKRSECASW